MINSGGEKVTMKLSADELFSTGKPINLPTVTLASEAGVKYTEGEDFTLTYYQVIEGADGELTEIEVAKGNIKDIGTYAVVAKPTGNGVLSGDACAQFVVNPPILGDVDGNGVVDIRDVTAIQRHASEFNAVPCFEAADIDGNGVVDIQDATLIQRFLAEFDVPFTIGQPITQS